MVIQRIQSLLLLMSAILMAVFGCLVPVAEVWYVAALAILTAVVNVIAIFCFKNFKTQFMVINLSMLLTLATIVIAAVMLPESVHFSLFALPVFAVVSQFYAKLRVRKDKQLLDSANRLR